MKRLFMTLMSSMILIGISFAQSTPTTPKEAEIDTYYYENSTVEISEGVDMKTYTAVKPNTTFKLKDGNAKVTVILKLDKPFQTKKVVVDIYDENDELYDTFEVDAKEDWDFISFNVDFDTEGQYFLDLYTADDIFINSAEVQVE